MSNYQAIEDFAANDMEYACQFRGEDTEQGSFRSHSFGWSGDTAIMAATHRLFMLGETVMIHICDHTKTGSQTVGVIKCWVEKANQRANWYVAYISNVGACESKLSEYNPTHFACQLALHVGVMISHLGTNLGTNLGIYLQPTTEQYQELKEAQEEVDKVKK